MSVELADLTARLRDPDSPQLVSLAPVATLTWHTDPWSVWCFALEPAILRLRLTFGSQLRVKVALGGIIEERPPGSFDVRGVAQIFETARSASQQPITTRALFEDPPSTTFPAGIAVAAVRLAEPSRAEEYLRHLRELALVVGVNVSRKDVTLAAVRALGIDEESYREAWTSGEAEREFQQDLASGIGRGIRAYPTLVFEKPGAAPVALSGLHHFPVLKGTFMEYTQANLREHAMPSLEDLIRVRGHVTTREAAEVLDVGIEEAYERLQRLEDNHEVHRSRHPGGIIWEEA